MHTPTQSSSSLPCQKPTLYKVRIVFYMPVHAEVAQPVLTMALSKASLAASTEVGYHLKSLHGFNVTSMTSFSITHLFSPTYLPTDVLTTQYTIVTLFCVRVWLSETNDSQGKISYHGIHTQPVLLHYILMMSLASSYRYL